jgi:hypothetical protein
MVSGGSIYRKDTIKNTLSNTMLALTMIDAATGWFEIIATNKTETSIQGLFHNTWLARYPQPQFIVFDNWNGRKLKSEFKQICDNYGIKAKPNTRYSIPSTSKCNH